MGAAEAAREEARQPTGKFGVQEQSQPEVEVTAPALWTLEVLYVDGGTDTIELDNTGELPTPFRSDRLLLTALIGFNARRFTPGIELAVEDAIAEPARAIGMFPAFDTYDGTTNLSGAVTVFQPKS